jgi:translation initiation factor IF-3
MLVVAATAATAKIVEAMAGEAAATEAMIVAVEAVEDLVVVVLVDHSQQRKDTICRIMNLT